MGLLGGARADRIKQLATITDESVYNALRHSDYAAGRWIAEDPSVRAVQGWLRRRR
jgi:hypothetical protein